ncbi:MAG: DoxX family membrane protein [candidate division Zixibacteria bacterium]|nr:DoxX family membrane protein [candidate division Zixibacteria bacterium]
MWFQKLINNDYIGLLIRVFVGGIFIYASLDKIAHPAQFARLVFDYHLVPLGLTNIFALILPWLEFISGLSFILGVYRRGGILIVNALIISFILALGVNLFRGLNIDCGCFTVSSNMKSSISGLLVRDLGLLVLGAYLYFNHSTRFDLIKSPKESSK